MTLIDAALNSIVLSIVTLQYGNRYSSLKAQCWTRKRGWVGFILVAGGRLDEKLTKDDSPGILARASPCAASSYFGSRFRKVVPLPFGQPTVS
ncbi:hypothetical protein HOLleu_15813 [Holothuria leucospilota]|uniref:Uncharacterized protein n=1 Tax=Holothuria leucospilota TaxID=206669 RepID=A0A9Q1C545_HOLLE|nr:hypothetical protein HOLleu_15813 [Holothuria leucospilota]